MRCKVEFNNREEGYVTDDNCILVEEWQVLDLEVYRVVAVCQSEADAKLVAKALEALGDQS